MRPSPTPQVPQGPQKPLPRHPGTRPEVEQYLCPACGNYSAVWLDLGPRPAVDILSCLLCPWHTELDR